jgi:excinuclease UvrABC nuclease subunit
MKVEELTPLPKNKVRFTLSAFKTVPKETGCYVLATVDNNILYIGLSDNLFERFQQHLGNPLKTNPTKEGRAI